MALSTAAKKSQCATCEKNTGIFTCGGCNRAFCTKHANEHRQILGKQMDEIVFEHDQLRQSINEQIDEINQSSSIKAIDEWQRQSIDKIYQAAENAREKLKQCMKERTQYMQTAVQKLTEKLNKARMEDDFVETDLKQWSDKINKLRIDISTSIPIAFKSINDVEVQINDSLFSRIDQQNSGLDPEEKRESIFASPENQISSPTDTTLSAFAAGEEDSQPRIIELPKPAEGLGFVITGGREYNSPLYISRIIPNRAAWKHGRLKIGDQLLSVNGISVENEDHTKAVELLKQAEGSVKLVVRYSPQLVIEMENRF